MSDLRAEIAAALRTAAPVLPHSQERGPVYAEAWSSDDRHVVEVAGSPEAIADVVITALVQHATRSAS